MAIRILIVEDEQIIAADLAGRLAQMGHEVVGIASEGHEAVELAKRVKPELVLMDVKLEGEMTGTEAARTIQDLTGAGIVFVTAFPNVLLRQPPQLSRPGICLGKPFSRIQLEAALHAAFQHRSPGETSH